MTREEQFIIDMTSCLNDTINGHIGLLKRVAERLDRGIMDSVHGCLRDLLWKETQDLERKRQRGMEKIHAFAGGEEAYHAISARWWQEISDKAS